MKYSPGIIGEIVRRLSGHYPPTAVRSILEALESTDEQIALRADAARYRMYHDPSRGMANQDKARGA